MRPPPTSGSELRRSSSIWTACQASDNRKYSSQQPSNIQILLSPESKSAHVSNHEAITVSIKMQITRRVKKNTCCGEFSIKRTPYNLCSLLVLGLADNDCGCQMYRLTSTVAQSPLFIITGAWLF